MKNKLIWFCLLCLVYAFNGCVEEVPFETNVQSEVDIEEILIVEATITNELKRQEIRLSRGKSFANDSIDSYEQNAVVDITDDLGNRFTFTNEQNGTYLSTEAFAAQNGRSYSLSITTARDETFESEPVVSAGVSTIDAIYAERIINDNGAEGMAIFVDSSNPSGDFNNYRYIYEETYKIIAPNWTAFEFEIIRENTEFILDDNGEVTDVLYPDVQLVPRAQEERVCYNTTSSTDIILSDGVQLNNNNIGRNIIRFINRDSAILSHRYSILVKQFLQTPEATNFYNTLFQFSQNENLFSEVQPGLLEGNLAAKGNTQTPVIGYFEVASVTEERLFFSYEDFFPDEPLPPYFGMVNCDRLIAPLLGNPLRDGPVPPMAACGEDLISLIQSERVEFVLDSAKDECEGPYFVTQRACGDCTALGSNEIPEFWTE